MGIFAGAVAGGIAIKNKIEYNTTGNGAYLDAIKSRYEKVDETLMKRINKDTYFDIFNKKVQTIRFEEPGLNDVELVINYDGNDNIDNKELQAKAIYKVLIDYYNALVDAESSGNMIDYLDCLNEVFENMNFESKEVGFKMQPLKFEGRDEDASEKINNLLGLEKTYDGIVKQVAFLPYNIEVVEWNYDRQTRMFTYTYKLSGISYCETVGENNDQIENSDDLISDKTYNKNKIKAYYRDVEISSSNYDEGPISQETLLKLDMQWFVENKKTEEDFEVKTTYFEEAKMFNVFEEFLKMKNGNFDYEKPENVDMNEYK